MSRAAFANGLVIECAGPQDEVMKILPALTIPEAELHEGLDILERCLSEVRDTEAVQVVA